MIRSIKTCFPTVVNCTAPIDKGFEEAEYGTLSINDQPPIPVPTETLELISEQIRLATIEDTNE